MVLAERVGPKEQDVVEIVNDLVRLGDEAGAEELVLKAWKQQPRPELARAFASLRPDETLDERCARFRKLLSINPEHAESLSLKAELALAAEDWVAAYDAISSVREDVPSPRTWAIVAAISRGSGAPDSIVRAWLKRALEAPAGDESEQGQARASITPLLILPKAGKENSTDGSQEAAEPKGRSQMG